MSEPQKVLKVEIEVTKFRAESIKSKARIHFSLNSLVGWFMPDIEPRDALVEGLSTGSATR